MYLYFSFLCTAINEAKSISDKPYDGILLVSHSVQALGEHDAIKALFPAVTNYMKVFLSSSDLNKQAQSDTFVFLFILSTITFKVG